MANGFGGIYVGGSGLQNAQAALNTTANNLANMNTTGYVRQQVRFADKNYTTLQKTTSRINLQQSGLGVSIGDVVHARDIFLDKAFRQESSRSAFYSTMYESVSSVEDMFQELNGEEFRESIVDFRRSFQELSKAPSDSTNINLVLQKAELFVSRCQGLYSDLQTFQDNLNKQIFDDVQKMNEIGKRVYDLNIKIVKVEAGGMETAMTYRDERDELLDQLGQYGNITTREDQFGFVSVSIDGVDYIDENKCYEIGLKKENGTGFYTPYWPQLSDVSSEEYVEVFRQDQEISTEYNTDTGKIKALLLSRGMNYGRYTDLEDENGYERIKGSVVMEVQAEVDRLFHKIATGINDLLCPNKELGQTITTTDGVTYGPGTKVLDTAKCTVGENKELPPEELFARIGAQRYTTVTGNDGNTYYIYNEERPEDSSTLYMIGSTTVNRNLQQQITKMPIYTQNGAVDFALAKNIENLWLEKSSTLNPDDRTPGTFEGYYNKIISQLGLDGNTYSSAMDTLAGTVSAVDNQRAQVTGVSSDEELTNMVKYQSAYNAASRYINVVNEMTELIVTGLV